MKFLLDTHILLWSLEENPKLAIRFVELLEDEQHEILVSSASLFEMAIKISLGKLNPPLGLSFPQLEQHLERRGVNILSLQSEHFDALRNLPFHHRDPFDRMLISQAICESATLLSDDQVFPQYAVNLIQ